MNRPALHLTSNTETRAYYRPSTDSVHPPARGCFVDTPHYYSTLFHELVHSTGHESRLHRLLHARFGEELYSKEELLAEMGAAFLCAIAGIANEHTDRNTSAYIQNWISKLEDANRLIFHAAANGQKAVYSILGTTFKETAETNEEIGEAAGSGVPSDSLPALAAYVRWFSLGCFTTPICSPALVVLAGTLDRERSFAALGTSPAQQQFERESSPQQIRSDRSNNRFADETAGPPRHFRHSGPRCSVPCDDCRMDRPELGWPPLIGRRAANVIDLERERKNRLRKPTVFTLVPGPIPDLPRKVAVH